MLYEIHNSLFQKMLFRHKIFLALVLLNFLLLSMLAAITFYQNSKNFTERSSADLMRTDALIKDNLNYQVQTGAATTENELLTARIHEFSNIYNTKINVFDLSGNQIAGISDSEARLNGKIIGELQKNEVIVQDSSVSGGKKLYSSFSYISSRNQPVAILNLQKTESNSAASAQTAVLLKQYLLLLVFFVVLSALISWMISKNLTEKIAEIALKIKSVDLNTTNEPLHYSEEDEIRPLVNAYNDMQVEIQNQKAELQKSERSEAWKEMARQMVHEINNPLTPLRLTVQNFQRKFALGDENNPEKVKNLTNTVVHQIDIITGITKSFADFARMPVDDAEEIDIVENIRKTLSIFPEETVNFTRNAEEVRFKIDGLYLSRIVTNIVKNGIQAIPDDREKKIEVNLKDEKSHFLISVADNGKGISDENKDLVFQHNFTTKEEGMGIGLSMVKKIVENYGGEIWFESQPEFGTVFFIKFYKKN